MRPTTMGTVMIVNHSPSYQYESRAPTNPVTPGSTLGDRASPAVHCPACPGSPEFMAAYTEAMAGQRAPVTGPRKFHPGTMNALRV